jgi:hypothetical protein
MSARLACLAIPLLFACGRPVPAATGTPGAEFPHPADYANGTHGIDALAAPTPCARCHDADAETGSGPSCRSCHDYPHPADQHFGSVHGAAWAADANECSSCHGADGGRSPAGVLQGTCNACHTSYPHGPTILATHGDAVLAHGGPQACTTCHTEGLGKPRTCTECHEGYPHPTGWAARSAHGAEADATCTQSCHPADATSGTDGPASPACTSCHDLYPHPDGWSRAHLTPVQARGETSCQGCHPGSSLPGPDLPVSCAASCHGGGL